MGTMVSKIWTTGLKMLSHRLIFGEITTLENQHKLYQLHSTHPMKIGIIASIHHLQEAVYFECTLDKILL